MDGGSTFGTETIHAKILLNSKLPKCPIKTSWQWEFPYIIHPTPQVIIKDYTSLAPSLKSHPILCNKD